MGKNFIDLFCGAGGLSLGFEKAGFKCVGAIDISKACIDTHKLNFPDCVSINSDITKVKPDEFRKKIGNKKINLIIGGPPCPTFSTIGQPKLQSLGKKVSEDNRNVLFKNFLVIGVTTNVGQTVFTLMLYLAKSSDIPLVNPSNPHLFIL